MGAPFYLYLTILNKFILGSRAPLAGPIGPGVLNNDFTLAQPAL